MRTLQVLFIAAAALVFAPKTFATAEDFISLDQLLSKDQQAKLGVTAMRPDQRETLRQALIGLFQRGYQVGRSDGSSVARQPPSGLPPQTVVESQIDGDFNGWEGETIVKLMNGQIWQQAEYHYEYHYAYMLRLKRTTFKLKNLLKKMVPRSRRTSQLASWAS